MCPCYAQIPCLTLNVLIDSFFNKHRMVHYILLKCQNKIVFFSLKIIFVLANSVDPDEMHHYTAFHLGLHSLSTA